jgi:hypothetical protein
MDNFVGLLKEIETNNEIQTADFLSHDIPSVKNVSRIATQLLIDTEGKCNWDNIEILKLEGYSAFPVERDRYGWLIGGISTSKGVITYG